MNEIHHAGDVAPGDPSQPDAIADRRPGGEGRPDRERAGEACRLERRYRFSASHLYRRPEWSEQENRKRFGKCAIEPGHGHNYRLFVTVRGVPDPDTAFVVDLGHLDALVARLVLEPLDHQHLNHAIPDFAPGRTIPSSETLVLWIRRQLAADLPANLDLVRLRLEEDEDLASEWHAEDR
jgi:6-pyruvoyltetrahydropterin/6-carboxytetrahydropterin synthase